MKQQNIEQLKIKKLEAKLEISNGLIFSLKFYVLARSI